MEGSHAPEAVQRPIPTSGRSSRGYKLFKNPPQPHMCIQDSIKGTSEKLYINVMSWKQIGNARHCADLIPLYGGMQILPGCNPNCIRPPLIVFAVMVNPEVLKVNGKYAPNPHERDALVSLSCDFVEAMNPGLQLTRRPVILKDRDLAGELKDVWHAVQLQRDKEKLRNQEANNEVTHKIYHIDGPPERDPNAPGGDQIYNAKNGERCDNSENNVKSAMNDARVIDADASEEIKIKLDKKQGEIKQPLTSTSVRKNVEDIVIKKDPVLNDDKTFCSPVQTNVTIKTVDKEITNPKEHIKLSEKDSIIESGSSELICNNFDKLKTVPKKKSDVSGCENNSAASLNAKNLTHDFQPQCIKINPDSNDKSSLINKVALQSSNQVIPIISKSNITTLNDDNKDIPYVDEYHENDNNQIAAPGSVEGMFQNLSMSSTTVQMKNKDPSLPNFSDQRKVPLSSQKA